MSANVGVLHQKFLTLLTILQMFQLYFDDRVSFEHWVVRPTPMFKISGFVLALIEKLIMMQKLELRTLGLMPPKTGLVDKVKTILSR